MVRSEGGVGERSDSFDVDLGLAGRSRGRDATVTVTAARPGRRGRSGSRGAAWDLELAATRRWCKCSEWRAVKAFDIAMDMAMAARPENGRSRGGRAEDERLEYWTVWVYGSFAVGTRVSGIWGS